MAIDISPVSGCLLPFGEQRLGTVAWAEEDPLVVSRGANLIRPSWGYDRM